MFRVSFFSCVYLTHENIMKKEDFIRFINNRCTPTERDQWLRYLVDPKNEEETTKLLHEYWSEVSVENLETYPKLKKIYVDIRNRLEIPASLSAKKHILKIAASFSFLIIVFSSIIYLINSSIIENSESDLVYNPKGEKTKVVLPDGSLVWLNGDSQISYDKEFKENNRRIVHLEGEAYFDVVESANRPFFVKTNDLLIKVLGTKFNVMSYQDEDKIETVLEYGKVAIQTLEKDIVYLNPNERATLTKQDKVIRKDTVETIKFTSWKDGYLVFRGDPFSEIILRLERWFDVNIELIDPDHLANQTRYTFMLHNERIENVLDLLSRATISANFKYEIKGRNVTIKLN